MPFPDNLRRLRRERYLTQTALAKAAGLTQVTIARLERGTQEPSFRSLQRLAQVLGVQPGDLATPDEAFDPSSVEKLQGLAA